MTTNTITTTPRRSPQHRQSWQQRHTRVAHSEPRHLLEFWVDFITCVIVVTAALVSGSLARDARALQRRHNELVSNHELRSMKFTETIQQWGLDSSDYD